PSQALRSNGGVWGGVKRAHGNGYALDKQVKFSGARSIRMDFPITSTEWARGLKKLISPVEPVLFARAYMRYDQDWNLGGGHRGINMSGQYPGPCNGTPRDGAGGLLLLLQNYVAFGEPQPGYGHVYAYWPLQSGGCGDHWYPTGQGFPWKNNPSAYPDFVPMDNFNVPRGQWFEYEFMVKVNDLG